MKDIKKGIIFILTGPSGVGKGTVVNQVLKKVNNIYLSVSATTRPKREGEIEGINYFFKTQKDFEEMIKADELLEWAEFTGHYYGTPKLFAKNYISANKDVLLEIEVKGAKQVKQKSPESILIFLMPPSFKVLEERLINRHTETAETIKLRLNKAKEEMKEIDFFNYKVINDQIEDAVSEVISIINTERSKKI